MADSPPLYTPEPGTSADEQMRRSPRHGLRPGYPDDLSRESAPEAGSIGDKSMPIKNREAPWRSLKGGK